MAGVVRRDGLRDGCSADGVHETHVLTEELDDLRYRVDRYEFENRALLRAVAAVQDLRDECASSGKIHYEHLAVRLTAVLDAVPDVPPDPPAVDVEKLARILGQHRLIVNYGDCMCRCGEQLVKSPNDSAAHIRETHRAHVAAYLVSSGVLVDAADVRARAQEAAWDEGYAAARDEDYRHERDGGPDVWTRNPYRSDRAVSERDRGTT